MTAPFVYDGAMNGNVFLAYEQVLVPPLQIGYVVIMDNLPTYKTAGVCDAIQRAGAEVIFLSPYSPDFNPIRNAFSKLKVMREAKPSKGSMLYGMLSGYRYLASQRQNTQTTSRPLDMTQIEQEMLVL